MTDVTSRSSTDMRGAGLAAALSGHLRRRLNSAQLRSFSMILILIVVWCIFQTLTSGIFLTPRNLTNLSGQVAISAILSAGIVLVMVPGYIDLSIGATVSFCAIVAAMASTTFGLPIPVTILLTLLVGLIIGLWHAVWIAWLRVPAFIVTLASLLAIRGLSLVVTSSETIAPDPRLLFISDYSLSTLQSSALVLLCWLGFSTMQIVEYLARRSSGMEASLSDALSPCLMAAIAAIGAVAMGASYRGIPFPVCVLLVVIMVTAGILRYTAFGRRLYAIGGNRQAAAMAGVDIRRHTFMVMAGMGLLYGVAGLVLVARLASAPPDAANGLELDVIAAAVIGGTSLLGGRGTVGGAVIGAILMESLSNGMSLMNLPSAFQAIAVGLVLLAAVYMDIRGRGRRNATD
jgi:D-xylose transport system permease protein